MIVLASLVLGVLFGVYTAGKRNGTGLDKAQFGAVYGMAFALAGLFVTLGIDRLAG